MPFGIAKFGANSVNYGELEIENSVQATPSAINAKVFKSILRESMV